MAPQPEYHTPFKTLHHLSLVVHDLDANCPAYLGQARLLVPGSTTRQFPSTSPSKE